MDYKTAKVKPKFKSEYSKNLTKEYLQSLGITDVSVDGKHIYKGENELKQYINNSANLIICVYDSSIARTNTKLKLERGQFFLTVGRVVYAWYVGEVPYRYVVSHKDNNRQNNSVDNLILLSPQENVTKNKVVNKRLVKCKLDKPRKFYEEKLKSLLKDYEKAKKKHNAKACHNTRDKVAYCRGQLRYYDTHNKIQFKKNI